MLTLIALNTSHLSYTLSKIKKQNSNAFQFYYNIVMLLFMLHNFLIRFIHYIQLAHLWTYFMNKGYNNKSCVHISVNMLYLNKMGNKQQYSHKHIFDHHFNPIKYKYVTYYIVHDLTYIRHVTIIYLLFPLSTFVYILSQHVISCTLSIHT